MARLPARQFEPETQQTHSTNGEHLWAAREAGTQDLILTSKSKGSQRQAPRDPPVPNLTPSPVPTGRWFYFSQFPLCLGRKVPFQSPNSRGTKRVRF